MSDPEPLFGPKRTNGCRDIRKWAVFLDRDGTLNVEHGLIRRAEDLEVFPFAGSAIRRLNEAEWRTILVSNQPVIARGEVTDSAIRSWTKSGMTIWIRSARFCMRPG